MPALDSIADELRRERLRAKYARDVARAKRRRTELIEKLGGCCEVCGVVDDLEINHVHRRSWEPRKLSFHCRVARYWREFKAGVKLNVLCRTHNARYVPLDLRQCEVAA